MPPFRDAAKGLFLRVAPLILFLHIMFGVSIFGSVRNERSHRGANQSFFYNPLQGGLCLPEHFSARIEQVDDKHVSFRGALLTREKMSPRANAPQHNAPSFESR